MKKAFDTSKNEPAKLLLNIFITTTPFFQPSPNPSGIATGHAVGDRRYHWGVFFRKRNRRYEIRRSRLRQRCSPDHQEYFFVPGGARVESCSIDCSAQPVSSAARHHRGAYVARIQKGIHSFRLPRSDTVRYIRANLLLMARTVFDTYRSYRLEHAAAAADAE